jgi:hypothetical protein
MAALLAISLMASSDDSRWLAPDPRTSALGDITDRVQTAWSRVRGWDGLLDARDADRGASERLNTRGGTSAASGKRSEQIEPPRDAYAKYRTQYDTTPLLSAPIDQAVADALSDGWRITADDDRTEQFLTQWAEQCAIVAGEPNRDLGALLDLWGKVWYIYGEPITENVPARERPDAVAALKMVPPSTISYHTRPGSSMLLQPGDTDLTTTLTESGDAAAYTQYDREADETWTDGAGQRLAERRLSFDDLTTASRNPDVGAVTGTSAIEAVSEQVETLKETLRNDAQAIESAAWGQYFAGFEPLVVDKGQDGVEIIEHEDGKQQDFLKNLETIEPGGVVTHDGQINIQNMPGEVADIHDRFTYLTKYIMTAMPAPQFTTPYSDNLNRDIAEEKNQLYQRKIDALQDTITTTFEPIFHRVAEQHAYPTEGIELSLEAPADDSPILSLEDADIDNIETYAKALDTLAGDAPATTLVSEEDILSLVLQLPEGAGVPTDGDVSVDEQDEQVMNQFADMQDELGVSPEGNR